MFSMHLYKRNMFDTKHAIDWSLLQLKPEGEFSPKPLHILDKREVQLRKCILVQLKVQWKHFEVDEAT